MTYCRRPPDWRRSLTAVRERVTSRDTFQTLRPALGAALCLPSTASALSGSEFDKRFSRQSPCFGKPDRKYIYNYISYKYTITYMEF